MTVYLDTQKQRIICRWLEPTEYIMNKRKVIIERSKYIWAKITKRGKVSKTDKDRYGEHPMFGHIQRFSRELQNRRVLENDGEQGACKVCGSRNNTVMTFDPGSSHISWLCRKHLEELENGN